MASSPRRVAMMSCSGAVEFLPSCTGSSTTPRRRSPLPDLRDIMSHTLVVLPDDTAEPFVAAIAAARKSLRIKMFLFSDPTLLAAVIARFIDSAKHSLWVQNERYQDQVIIERLVRAVERGVKVHVMARPPHTLKKDKLIEGVGGLRILHDVGAKVHKPKGLRLHAKMLLADGARAIVGSINLAPGSFDGRRALAIETDDRGVIKRLHDVVQKDWEASRKLDLSDEGLLADLEKRGK